MTLPGGVRRAVEAALGRDRGRPGSIAAVDPVGGGCISPVARLGLEDGERFFLKWATPEHPSGLLAAEARGLELLADTGTIRVPAVVACSTEGDGWLLLEWIEPGSPTAAAWRHLGAGLAALHGHRGEDFGDRLPNFIGPLPQANAPAGSWAAFWRERRLEPQLRRAVDAGAFTAPERARFDRLMDSLEEWIGVGDAEGPSVLHGDLWSGNVHMAAEGDPAIIDPSAYHGHREVDLAMAELFGGFGGAFRAAYEEAWPLEPGYAPVRRAVYQLYYLLVHVNLFGAGYVAGCRGALRDAGV